MARPVLSFKIIHRCPCHLFYSSPKPRWTKTSPNIHLGSQTSVCLLDRNLLLPTLPLISLSPDSKFRTLGIWTITQGYIMTFVGHRHFGFCRPLAQLKIILKKIIFQDCQYKNKCNIHWINYSFL